MVNKRVWNAVLGCNLQNNRMISVHFQGKPFNIMVIQACAPTSNAEEAEVAGLMKIYQYDFDKIFACMYPETVEDDEEECQEA